MEDGELLEYMGMNNGHILTMRLFVVILDMRRLVSFDRRMNNCDMMIYLVLILYR